MKEKIWRYLIDAGLTEEGAAGLMGNLQAESGLIPNRVETLCLKRLKEVGKYYTNATYTAFVDDGTINLEEFLHPLPGKQYGYGLAQWTSPSRKTGLYTLAKANKTSIGDITTQLQWLITELKQSYPNVWAALSTGRNVRAASDVVLTQFEQPADTGSAVKEARYRMSLAIYEEMKQMSVTAKTVLDVMRSWIGFSEANGRYKNIIDVYNQFCAQRGSYPRGYRVPYGVAWCDVTVSAAFIYAGGVSLIGDIECGVQEHIAIFKKKGIWIEDGSVTPKPGDIICYNWDDSTQPNNGYADHIGLVESVAGGQIVTIEGNTSGGQVARKTIPVGYGYIRGFARPAYGASEAVQGKTPTVNPIVGTCQITLKQFLHGANDPQIKAIQRILNDLGYVGRDGQRLAVDGSLGANTAFAISKFQQDKGMSGINFGSVAGTTWKYLLEA